MSPVKNTGRFATEKADKSQDFESLLERDFLTLLEYDTRVHTFAVQPITLRWADPDGTKHRYTPDVVVNYKPWLASREPSLALTLFEVKPRDILERHWEKFRPRFKAAMAWTRSRGYRFKIVTEKEIRTPYLANVRFLLRFRSSMPCDSLAAAQQDLVLQAIRRLQKTTPNGLLEALTPSVDHRAELLPWIWHLINCNLIGCDLSAPLNMESAIWSQVPEESPQ